MIPLVGFLPADDERSRGTLAAVRRGLMRDGFVHRHATLEHVDGLPPGEASFIPCSFWFVDNLALMGHRDEAVEMFERLLSIRNDLGLLSEEYDSASGRLLGNFPQAFSHVSLINSARNLAAGGGPADNRAHASA
jgi:GH15 family glucan-1,4-alpha-glucosidase